MRVEYATGKRIICQILTVSFISAFPLLSVQAQECNSKCSLVVGGYVSKARDVERTAVNNHLLSCNPNFVSGYQNEAMDNRAIRTPGWCNDICSSTNECKSKCRDVVVEKLREVERVAVNNHLLSCNTISVSNFQIETIDTRLNRSNSWCTTICTPGMSF